MDTRSVIRRKARKTNREVRRKLRRLPRETRRVQITDPGVRIVKTSPRDGGVRIEARQGVWTHSFIRNDCGALAHSR